MISHILGHGIPCSGMHGIPLMFRGLVIVIVN